MKSMSKSGDIQAGPQQDDVHTHPKLSLEALHLPKDVAQGSVLVYG